MGGRRVPGDEAEAEEGRLPWCFRELSRTVTVPRASTGAAAVPRRPRCVWGMWGMWGSPRLSRSFLHPRAPPPGLLSLHSLLCLTSANGQQGPATTSTFLSLSVPTLQRTLFPSPPRERPLPPAPCSSRPQSHALCDLGPQPCPRCPCEPESRWQASLSLYFVISKEGQMQSPPARKAAE